jgi:hypothetical protein
MIGSLIGEARRGRIKPVAMPIEKPMVPTLSERLRRRAYECYSPRHIRIPWQVSPELPTALFCLAAARASVEVAAQVSPEALAKSMASAQPNQPQLQPISPLQILPAAAGTGPGEGIASNPALLQVPPGQVPPSQELTDGRLAAGQRRSTQAKAGRSSSEELVLLLVLSLLTLLDGAKALRHLLIGTASVWRPRQQLAAALPTRSPALGANRGIHQPGVSGRFPTGAEWIQQRLIFHLFGPALLSRRR